MKKCCFLGSRDVRLLAEVAGSPTAPGVILLHGGGQTRHPLKTLAATLAGRGYHVNHPQPARARRERMGGGWRLPARRLCCRPVRGDRQLPRPPVVVRASLGGLRRCLRSEKASGSSPPAWCWWTWCRDWSRMACGGYANSCRLTSTVSLPSRRLPLRWPAICCIDPAPPNREGSRGICEQAPTAACIGTGIRPSSSAPSGPTSPPRASASGPRRDGFGCRC